MNVLSLVSLALVSVAAAAGERPGVFWWSAPVEPGELVQVQGGAWGEKPAVELLASGTFSKARRTQPVNVTDTGICFEFPRAFGAGDLVSCRIVNEAGLASDPFILNEPQVWWLQGDLGSDASPGGWLRLFGRCLDRGGHAQAVLRGGKRDIPLTVTQRDAWSVDTTVPSSVPPGTYTVSLSNGAGGREGWRDAGSVVVRPYQEVWRTERFDVTRFGAIPNDGLDDTLALQAALAQAATNGGGVVFLPRGRFQCTGTLQIPPRTLLRGESRETTSLYWPDCEEPPENLIEGTTAFGIEDLFIHAGKYRNGIVCKNASAGQHELGGGIAPESEKPRDITIRRVRLKLIIDQYLLKNTAEYEKRAYLRGNGLVIRDARFVRVEDCDLFASKEGSSTLYFVLSADCLLIRNCRINGSGWAVVGGDRVIFENNEAYNCTYSIAPVCRNLFWSQNRQHDLFTNNRESITHDGARTAFRGLLPAACDGTKLALDFGGAKAEYRNGAAYWVGQNVQLVEGRGAGQTRTVTAISDNVVTLDRPWTVAPDATSRFVVAAERRHLIYADNDTEDSSIAIQLYGGLTDGALVRNRCARAGGFRGFGMDYHAIIPLWYVQCLDNEILEGNGYRGPSNQIPPEDSELAILDHGNGMTLTRSCVIRRGVLHNNARVVMSCENGFVENCVVSNADCGISIAPRHAPSIVLKGNRFSHVSEPLDRGARQLAVMHPAERALTLLGAAEESLGAPPPPDWLKIKAELSRDADALPASDPRAGAAASRALVQALRTLGAAPAGGARDMRTAEALLGASLRIQSWDSGMTRLLGSDRAAEATVSLLAELAPDAPPATCSITFADMPGWTIPPVTGVSLSPEKPAEIKVPMRAPEGAKGFFRLPAEVCYSGDGWTLTCRDNLQTLTENRLCQWVAAAPFDTPAQALAHTGSWQVLTNANVHGALDFRPLFASAATGQIGVAAAVLRATQPTPLRFTFSGPVQLFLDGARLGTDAQRGSWGTVSLAPGDHTLKALLTPTKKDAGTFKVSCQIAENCLPGQLTVLPASEALRFLAPAAQAR